MGKGLQKAKAAAEATQDSAALTFWYKNYKGDEGYRRVRPISIRFGTSEWHKEPQWLMLAYDTVNNKQREFAMMDISGVIGTQIVWIHQVTN